MTPPTNVAGATGVALASETRRAFPRVQREHLLLAALLSISWGALVNYGYLSLPAFVCVLAGLVMIATAMTASSRAVPAGRVWWGIAAIGLAIATFRYAGYLQATPATVLSAVLVGAVALASVIRPRRLAVGACLVGAAAVAGLTALGWRWGHAGIDVFSGLRMAADALIHGKNPYEPTFLAMVQTAPNLFVDQPIHFDYLPGAVLLVVPGQLVGDVRVISVIASLAVVAFTVRLARHSSAKPDRIRIFALCVAMPLTTAMTLNAWLDVYSLAGFAGWLALRSDHRRWAVVCLVVSLTVKPTLIFALVPFLLWSPRARQELCVALVGATCVILPFAAITGVPAFYRDVAEVFGSLGFRYDGLTLSAWWYDVTRSLVPVPVSLSLAAATAFFTLRKRPVDTTQALIAGAVLTTAAFLLGKQAFLNYYYIPAWLIIMALAIGRAPIDDATEPRLPAWLSVLPPTLSRARRGIASA